MNKQDGYVGSAHRRLRLFDTAPDLQLNDMRFNDLHLPAGWVGYRNQQFYHRITTSFSIEAIAEFNQQPLFQGIMKMKE